jgi:hypothetical protein
VDCDAAQLVAQNLAFSSVQTRSHHQAKCPDGVSDPACASDRSGWAVEGGEDAVSSRVDFATSELDKLPPHDPIELLESVSPASVAQRHDSLAGCHEVDEEDCEKHTIHLSLVGRAREEFFDFRCE